MLMPRYCIHADAAVWTVVAAMFANMPECSGACVLQLFSRYFQKLFHWPLLHVSWNCFFFKTYL